MNERENKKSLRELARESMEEAVEIHEEELKALREAAHSDLERLRPNITDKTSYDNLIAAVEESTKKNESLSQLKERLKEAGSGTLEIGREITRRLKGF